MFNPLITLTLLLLLAVTLASPAGGPVSLTKSFTVISEGRIIHSFATLKCETTSASPTITEIRGAVANVRALEGDVTCSQDNSGGSKCTRIARYIGADISLCGRWKSRISCTTAADAAETVGNACVWNGKAGGRWYFDDLTLNLAVH